MNVILYTQETCGPCQEQKIWFKENSIDFEERDIRKNDAYLQELIQLGAAATPVTIINKDGSENVVFHFNKEELAVKLGL